MYAQFYERDREDKPAETKPLIVSIFARTETAADQGLAIKTLYLTSEEFTELERELAILKKEINGLTNLKDGKQLGRFFTVGRIDIMEPLPSYGRTG